MTGLLVWCAAHIQELLILTLCGLAVLIAVFFHGFTHAIRREMDYHEDLRLMRKIYRENHKRPMP